MLKKIPKKKEEKHEDGDLNAVIKQKQKEMKDNIEKLHKKEENKIDDGDLNAVIKQKEKHEKDFF